ncbi:hypothetical protein VTK73DRAFT_8932 [Phialemonium thermophilum]|uniref:Uncharacterized protein n=1 Tax=Phialemonium thermophilum TaxID=223376 RepID=A0ABR3W585_9PEZI
MYIVSFRRLYGRKLYNESSPSPESMRTQIKRTQPVRLLPSHSLHQVTPQRAQQRTDRLPAPQRHDGRSLRNVHQPLDPSAHGQPGDQGAEKRIPDAVDADHVAGIHLLGGRKPAHVHAAHLGRDVSAREQERLGVPLVEQRIPAAQQCRQQDALGAQRGGHDGHEGQELHGALG